MQVAGAATYIIKCGCLNATCADYRNCTQEVPVAVDGRIKFADPFTWIIKDYPTVMETCRSILHASLLEHPRQMVLCHAGNTTLPSPPGSCSPASTVLMKGISPEPWGKASSPGRRCSNIERSGKPRPRTGLWCLRPQMWPPTMVGMTNWGLSLLVSNWMRSSTR